MRHIKTRVIIVVLAVVLAFVPFTWVQKTQAVPNITFRSVTISSAMPSAVVSETFAFSLASTFNIGSIVFEHCGNSPLPEVACVAPAGFSAASAVLTAQTTNTGFTIDSINSTVNKIVLTRPPAAGVLGNTTFGFTTITNPSTPSTTNYVRIATYASTDGTGVAIDIGSMAYAILGGFSVGAYVPPFLIFCVGITVGSQCTSATGSLISFGELASNKANYDTSQFAGATNDPTGYSVFYDGHTMTAGNQVITALASPTASAPGTGQFGFNLRSNTNPLVGANPSGAGTSTITAGYNTPNLFKIATGDQLTASTTSTDFNYWTVSYLVNIPPSQPPGYYATTLTFIAVASF